MKKKLLSVLLVAVMAVTALTGCGNKSGNNPAVTQAPEKTTDGASSTDTNSTDTSSKEVVTLTFATLGTEAACQAQVLDAVNKKLLADGLNIQIQVKQIDDYWNKLALDIAGGTEYDIAWAHSTTLSDLVAKKVYQPITQALDTVGQDLKAKMPDFMLKGATLNGEIYAIPRIVPTTGSNNTFDVRKDLMTKYGMKDITTLEELEAYFKAVQDNEDGVAPYSGGNFAPLLPVFANYHFILGDGIYAMYVDPSDPELKVKSFLESDEFVKICEKRKEWNEKGWLLTDMSAIENPDNGFDYGKVAAVDSNVMRVTERVDTITKNVPGAEPYTVYLEPQQRWIFNAGDNMLAVPSTSKHVNEAIQFIQWFRTNQENYDLWSYGVEGVNYEKNGEAIDITNIAPENVYSPMVWMWNDLDKARFSANYPAESIQRLKDWDSNSKVSPLLGFTLDQTNIKAECSQILAVMTEYYGSLGDGTQDIHKVRDELIKKMKDAGIDKVIEETQKQVDAFVGK